MNRDAVRPGRVWYAVAIAMMLGGVVCGPALVFSSFFGQPPGQQFLVPGKATIAITAPGKYVLWDNYETLYEGKQYSSDTNALTMLIVKLKHRESGDAIEMAKGFNASERFNSSARRSVGTFELRESGDYEIDVSGNFPNRVFLLREARLEKFFKGIVFGIGIAVFGVLGGIALAIGVFLKRKQANG